MKHSITFLQKTTNTVLNINQFQDKEHVDILHVTEFTL